jgi:hypothetical protein
LADEVNMLNPISSNNVYLQQATYQAPTAKPTAEGQTGTPTEDTVELSSAAQAALGGAGTGGATH